MTSTPPHNHPDDASATAAVHHVDMMMTLTSKPHAFGGAVLTPKHARALTPPLALALASALSEHANASHGSSSSSQRGGAGGDPSMSPHHHHHHHHNQHHPFLNPATPTKSGGSNVDGAFRNLASTSSGFSSRSVETAGTGAGVIDGIDGGGGGVQYTAWITEAWKVLGWAEPSAALFWEMATMFHTLHVAGRAVEVPLSSSHQSYLSRHVKNRSGSVIPPILSIGSNSSIGSARSASKGGGMTTPSTPSSPVRGAAGGGPGGGSSSTTSNKHKSSASAKELPVWLIGSYLLLHAEEQSYLRSVSGEDERRFVGAGASHGGQVLRPAGGGNDVALSLRLHPILSARTRIHAGLHENNDHCAAYLLRHLRKFILLCAVPHNADAVWALAGLAGERTTTRGGAGGGSGGGAADFNGNDEDEYRDRQKGGAGPGGADRGGGLFGPHTPPPPLDVDELRAKHDADHGTVGVDVRLTIDDLDRLNLVLQAPSGGLIDDPPLQIGQYLVAVAGDGGVSGNFDGTVRLEDAEREVRRFLELELRHGEDGDDHHDDGGVGVGVNVRGEGADEGAGVVVAKLSNMRLSEPENLQGGSAPAATTDRKEAAGDEGGIGAGEGGVDHAEQGQGQYTKELRYTNLHGTTILLEPNYPVDSASDGPGGNASALAAVLSSNGRLHDLYVADCSDAHFYLLQPFEYATIAACTGCTIVVGAVAGLLHIVDCERTTITSASRRVLVGNSLEVTNFVFTPSPPLLVGDNRSCQFAPYNTYYDGLREDLLATGLAAAVVSSTLATAASSEGSQSQQGQQAQSSSNQQQQQQQQHGGADAAGGVGPALLQCASNKWNVPVELAKLEVPQIQPSPLTVSPPGDRGHSPGDDDKVPGKQGGSDDTMQTPIILPPSEFHVLFVPLESEAYRQRKRREQDFNISSPSSTFDELQLQSPGSGGVASPGQLGEPPGAPSGYCRLLADLLQLSPFRMPSDYERRALVKADRMKSLQQAMQTVLTPEQRMSLEEELNRGFRDWLVTSGNLRQVLDLVHMERKGGREV